MTAIVKNCLLATLVAAGLVASSGSASAAFNLRYEFLGYTGSGPNGTGPLVGNPASPPAPAFLDQNFPALTSGGNIDLFDGVAGNAGGFDLLLSYTATVAPVTGLTQINANVIWQINSNVIPVPPFDAIKFRLTATQTGVDLNSVTQPNSVNLFGVGFSIFGQDNSALNNVSASLSAPPINLVVVPSNIFPTFTPGTPRTSLDIFGAQVFGRGAGALPTGTLTYTAEFTLAPRENINLVVIPSLETNIIPAPAGLILAGLGLPALGLAGRLRRKTVA